jgi:ADP-L-glycero-D-manno-heptose 6-epimerase
MIIVTGAAGFIGSCLITKLNREGFTDLRLVDDFSKEEKSGNLMNKEFSGKTDREIFPEWFKDHAREVEFVFHIGARTDTTEFNMSVFDKLNLNYSKTLWKICAENRIPFVYASSAATYGDGSLGYSDQDPELSFQLQPLNPYGVSKNDFDQWAIRQPVAPPSWFGLKFFNVFGPNEYHKSRMASVIFHAYRQISETGRMKLFRSHRPDYADGGQLRDFVYVKDVVEVLYYLMKRTTQDSHTPVNSGLYNLGTGEARSFLDLANGVFRSLGREPRIDFIDTPEDIRDKYQYFTRADMNKLRSAGYNQPFYTLEEGIEDYVKHYLLQGRYF